MPVLLRPRQWGPTRSTAGTSINMGHPLANGLVHAWACNEGGGAYVRDLVGRAHTGSAANTTSPLRWAASPAGVGLATATKCAASQFLQAGTSITFFALVVVNAYQASSPFISSIIGDSADTTQLRFGDAGISNDQVQLVVAGGKRSGAIHSPTGRPLSIVATSSPARSAIYINGMTDVVGATLGNYNAETGVDCGLMLSPPNGRPLNGTFLIGAIWNRALSLAEAQWLYAEPYAFLVQPKRYVASPDGGGAVATKTYTLMPDMRNRSLPVLARSRRRP